MYATVPCAVNICVGAKVGEAERGHSSRDVVQSQAFFRATHAAAALSRATIHQRPDIARSAAADVVVDDAATTNTTMMRSTWRWGVDSYKSSVLIHVSHTGECFAVQPRNNGRFGQTRNCHNG